MITVQRKVRVGRCRRARKGSAAPGLTAGRVPRVARLMALAIRLDGLIRAGVVTDQAALARLGQVTRARLTQIMNLLLLAPEIQETLLFMPATERGCDAITERELRQIVAAPDWEEQRRLFNAHLSSMAHLRREMETTGI